MKRAIGFLSLVFTLSANYALGINQCAEAITTAADAHSVSHSAIRALLQRHKELSPDSKFFRSLNAFDKVGWGPLTKQFVAVKVIGSYQVEFTEVIKNTFNPMKAFERPWFQIEVKGISADKMISPEAFHRFLNLILKIAEIEQFETSEGKQLADRIHSTWWPCATDQGKSDFSLSASYHAENEIVKSYLIFRQTIEALEKDDSILEDSAHNGS